jgi:putative ABC transport system substrate-binding protein
MRRRAFIEGITALAAAGPSATRAQQSAMPVIGWLSSGSLAIEYRRADDQIERLPSLAADLVGRRVSLILAAGSPAAALAAKSATTSIPIVFNNASDPVQLGLVASLNRPGGNITGVTTISAELEAKRPGLLRRWPSRSTSATFCPRSTCLR